MQNEDWLDAIKWTADGLVPAVAQDVADGKILMHNMAMQSTGRDRETNYGTRVKSPDTSR